MKISNRLGALAAPVALATCLTAPAPAQAQDIEAYIGEMIYFSGNYCPKNWEKADGQLLNISSNPALFSVISNQYGGDGRTTFALPDLRGRVPIHQGQGAGGLSTYTVGQTGGAERVTLTEDQIAPHNHLITVNNSGGNVQTPSNMYLSYSTLTDGLPPDQVMRMFATLPTSATYLDTDTVTNTGGNQSHENRPPYFVANWCVAVQGIYPTKN